ncbi:hypothetical protein, partial [Thiolapillus sp.]|uniref:hypothetical protein n=1 Tax=Thiolapillus sp. TaxID=2017437 RepID=UPI003AF88606
VKVSLNKVARLMNKNNIYAHFSIRHKKAKIPRNNINFANRDLCINMNNHQNAIFHQITNFLKTPLALLGVDLKNFQFNKICHFANHPYLCKGLLWQFVSLMPHHLVRTKLEE